MARARAAENVDLLIAALNNLSRALSAAGAGPLALETARESLALAERQGDRHRLAALHLHDNDGTADQHRFPGEGNIDWRAFASAYHRSQTNASIMLECKPPADTPWSAAFQRLRAALGE